MLLEGYESPTSVAAPLEYISVDDYDWPKPPPIKRTRLDEQERRRRHTECQKRFLKRKQQAFEQLRREAARLDLQVKLLKAVRETEMLLSEQARLCSIQTGAESNLPEFFVDSNALVESLLEELDSVGDDEAEGTVP